MIRVLLLAVALTAQLVQGGSSPHLHVDSGPAFFNLDHDLSLLATAGNAAPVPADAVSVTVLPSMPALAVGVVARSPVSPLRYSAPRAPPVSG